MIQWSLHCNPYPLFALNVIHYKPSLLAISCFLLQPPFLYAVYRLCHMVMNSRTFEVSLHAMWHCFLPQTIKVMNEFKLSTHLRTIELSGHFYWSLRCKIRLFPERTHIQWLSVSIKCQFLPFSNSNYWIYGRLFICNRIIVWKQTDSADSKFDVFLRAMAIFSTASWIRR